METTNQNGAERRKLFIAVIAALLLINCVTVYFLYSEKHGKEDVTTQKTALEQNFKSLSDSLDAKNVQIDQYAGKNAEMDKQIAEKQDMLNQEKKQIAGLLSKNKLSSADLAKAKDMIAEYEASISDLQKKVDDLTQKNLALTQQNQGLSTDLSAEKQTTSQLTAQNQSLGAKVAVGSLLHLANLDVEAIKKRGNGKEVEVKRVKAAESLKISFETGENKVLDAGQVSLYVKIINPKGETIAVADQGSGNIQFPESSENVQYTKKADIDWNQTNKKVVVYWSQNIKDAGTYKVQVYQAGHVIGQGSVTLS